MAMLNFDFSEDGPLLHPLRPNAFIPPPVVLGTHAPGSVLPSIPFIRPPTPPAKDAITPEPEKDATVFSYSSRNYAYQWSPFVKSPIQYVSRVYEQD
jgi:hypothetical protein